jgi:D-glycero-D-manno-heptose 1,7-bisphosphate phosphatase
MILQALHDFGVKPENAFMAGDSPRDVEAAEAAGVRGYLYPGGSLLEFVQGILREEK